MAKTKEQLLNILDQFQLTEKVVSAEPFGNGHINDTLKVTNEKGEIKYVLQRINHLIFTNVDMLQNNIQIVTSHIRKKLEEKGENDIDRKVLTFLPTKDNKLYYFDGDNYWRVCLFIPNSKSYEEVTPFVQDFFPTRIFREYMACQIRTRRPEREGVYGSAGVWPAGRTEVLRLASRLVLQRVSAADIL